jgi:hypothetical protein
MEREMLDAIRLHERRAQFATSVRSPITLAHLETEASCVRDRAEGQRWLDERQQ